jgi:hypothetical protein
MPVLNFKLRNDLGLREICVRFEAGEKRSIDSCIVTELDELFVLCLYSVPLCKLFLVESKFQYFLSSLRVHDRS